MSDYLKEYTTDPFTLSLKVQSMKSGIYHVVGDVSAENWQETCTHIGVGDGGSCHIDIELEKASGFLTFKGTIKMQTTRTCVRTLEEFLLEETLGVSDRLCLAPEKAEELDEVFTEESLDLKEFLTQQIVVEMENYPVHPNTHSAGEGAFDVSDGQESEVADEKNPFSVLKHLKS